MCRGTLWLLRCSEQLRRGQRTISINEEATDVSRVLCTFHGCWM
ncbi:hypothetical protein LINPERPRIM_LOCUS35297, partial [Linum perenne]